MDLRDYSGKRVKIILQNDYYFVGNVITTDQNSIDIIDLRGRRVSLAKSQIVQIQEVATA